MIDREEMLELTRRMTASRTHLVRIAGAYLDEEGYVDGSFNTNFQKLEGAEKKHVIAIAKTIPFSETNVELKELRLPSGAMKKGSIWQALYALREYDLKNDAVLLSLYELLGEKLPQGVPYAIYLYEGIYDIHRKGSDQERQGESEEVYKYLLLALCPVTDDYRAGKPYTGFLWPAFKEHAAALNLVDFYEEGGNHAAGSRLREVLGIRT